MDAETYIVKHWIPHRVWEHLIWPEHQRRFKMCTGFLEGPVFADVGCACGHSTDIMARMKPGTWMGVDFSPSAIAMAEKLFPEYGFFISDLHGQISLPDGVDSAVCSEVIEHVDDDIGLMEFLDAITRRVIVVTTPSHKVEDPGHQRIYTEQSLLELGKVFGEAKVVIDNGFFYLEVRK